MDVLLSVFGFSWFFAATPAVLFLVVLRLAGRFAIEPLWAIGIAVLWGAGGGTGLGFLGSVLLEHAAGAILSRPVSPTLRDVCLVPVAEETAKAALLVLLVRLRRIEYATSGLTYGVAVGLGFAMTENLAAYLRVFLEHGARDWYGTVLLRTFFATVMHGCTTAAFGAALGHRVFLGREARSFRKAYVLLGAVMALLLHVGWNAAIGEGFPSLASGLVLVPLAVLGLLGVVLSAGRLEGRLIHAELLREAAEGCLPPEAVPLLLALRSRRRRSLGSDPAGKGDPAAMALRLALIRRRLRLGRGDVGVAASLGEERERLLRTVRETAGKLPPGSVPLQKEGRKRTTV